jgi:hypothetical protein
LLPECTPAPSRSRPTDRGPFTSGRHIIRPSPDVPCTREPTCRPGWWRQHEPRLGPTRVTSSHRPSCHPLAADWCWRRAGANKKSGSEGSMPPLLAGVSPSSAPPREIERAARALPRRAARGGSDGVLRRARGADRVLHPRHPGLPQARYGRFASVARAGGLVLRSHCP